MLVAVLSLNLLILGPVIAGLLSGGAGMAVIFGPDTPARMILLCVYAAIALVSAALIGLHAVGHGWAVPMTFALFAVQITYKLATVVAVGVGNPVVVTNLVVVAVQVIAIAAYLWRFGSVPA
ncbi:MAG: hypothetical protein AAFQ19_10680 [Pseudomonadota bacterium]